MGEKKAVGSKEEKATGNRYNSPLPLPGGDGNRWGSLSQRASPKSIFDCYSPLSPMTEVVPLLPIAYCLLPLAIPSWEGLGVGSPLLPTAYCLLPTAFFPPTAFFCLNESHS